MFTWRLCEGGDRKIWTERNKIFMDEEIQDDGFWNHTNHQDDKTFYDAFARTLKSDELIRLLIFEEKAVNRQRQGCKLPITGA